MGVAGKTVTGAVGAVVVGLAVAGTVIGWPRAWGWLTGWWTPGWGNLFTVAIATAAIAVSAAFNLATLRRSITQFQQVRVDATTDKLRNELVDFFADIEVCRTQTRKLGMRLQELAVTADSESRSNPEAIAEYRAAAYAAFIETLPDVHLRIAAHEFKLMMLTTDRNILVPTGKIRTLIKEDRDDFEVLVRADGSTAPSSLISERGDTMLERHQSRNGEIYEIIVDLGHYCAKTFAMTTD